MSVKSKLNAFNRVFMVFGLGSIHYNGYNWTAAIFCVTRTCTVFVIIKLLFKRHEWVRRIIIIIIIIIITLFSEESTWTGGQKALPMAARWVSRTSSVVPNVLTRRRFENVVNVPPPPPITQRIHRRRFSRPSRTILFDRLKRLLPNVAPKRVRKLRTTRVAFGTDV